VKVHGNLALVTPDPNESKSFFSKLKRKLGLRPRTISLEDAIAHHRPKPVETQVFSHWKAVVTDVDGNVKFQSHWKHNLTTDTASGFTNRRDWQSKLFGGGFAPFATAQGTLTASSATSATNGSAAFPTSGQGLSGCIVVVGANSSGTGSVVWGMIQSNTSTVLTVDQWYNGGTWATGTTPNATGQYIILPGGLPAMYLAVTSDSTAASSADTTLASEATTNGFARALATYAHTAAASTLTLQVLFTASGSLTPAKYANVGSSVLNKGVMPFESLISSAPVLISGDTLTLTATITIN
jgi:hypothetical protein